MIRILSFAHIFLITISNILVQYPFHLLGFVTTWGAITYPLIFLITDLTTRLFSAQQARKIIFISMFPGLLFSYLITNYLAVGKIFTLNIMPLRIASACFFAYVIGQLLDIFIFQKFRKSGSWWLAPFMSTTVGNFIDTFIFFFIAFYHSSNIFLSTHWMEIACVDLVFKIIISTMLFVPVYGYMVRFFTQKWLQPEGSKP